MENETSKVEGLSETKKPDFDKMLTKAGFKSDVRNGYNDVVRITDAEYLMDELWDELSSRIKFLEELAEERQTKIKEHTADFFRVRDENFALKKQVKELESPSVVEQKWISVMDRLPEKDGPVIINDTDSLTPVKCLNFEDGRFTFKAYGTSLDYTDHVNFWQPLPEPPRKSQPL